jgi:hypothetical protein
MLRFDEASLAQLGDELSLYDTERLIERASVSVVHGGSALRAAKSSKFDSETKLIALHVLVKIVLRRYYLLRSGDRK